MIQINNLKYSYSVYNEFVFPNFSLENDDNLLIKGKSGCGKTTLLNIISGINRPNSGQVIINDVDIYKLSEKKRDLFRGNEIGIVFQKPFLIPSLSVVENVEIASWIITKQRRTKQSIQLLEILGLRDQKNQKIQELSQGQQQRVAIARALINSPSLIIADEPTSSLDDENCVKVVELFLKTAKMLSANLILVTHDNRLSSYFNNKLDLI